MIGRPLNLLYPIECSEKGEDNKLEDEQLQTDTPVADVHRQSQPTRQAAVRALQRIQKQLNDDSQN